MVASYTLGLSLRNSCFFHLFQVPVYTDLYSSAYGEKERAKYSCLRLL